MTVSAVDCADAQGSARAQWRIDLYDEHGKSMRELARARRSAVALGSVTEASSQLEVLDTSDISGYLREQCRVRPSDRFAGCARLRILQSLLSVIDENGFERSNHQLLFHQKFIQACGRVLYREEWPVHRDAIMKHNGWATAPSECMVSTPRRFGKTFSVAMFCVCMALSFPVEIVVFSPARRASRKILERMREFAGTIGMEERILEYNQENLRMESLQGGSSLIRSFPSKVSVCTSLTLSLSPCHNTHTHTPMDDGASMIDRRWYACHRPFRRPVPPLAHAHASDSRRNSSSSSLHTPSDVISGTSIATPPY